MRNPLLIFGLLAVTQLAEGFDNLLLGKIAPILARSYVAPVESLSQVFVAHQIGLTLGALGAGMIFGRARSHACLVISVGLAGLSTLAVALAPSLAVLACIRFVSGIFLGASAPIIMATSIGLFSQRSAGMAVATILASYSLGSSAASAFALLVVDRTGWPAGFLASGFVLVILALLLRQMSPAIAAQVDDTQSSQVRMLFERGRRRLTIGLVTVNAMTMSLVGLMASWLPTFFEACAQVTVQRFASVGVLYAPAAIAGMMASGLATRFLGSQQGAGLVFMVHAVALTLLGLVAFETMFFPLVYFGSVAAQAGVQGAINIVAARSFAREAHAATFGLLGAAGRAAASVSPLLGAVAIRQQLSLAQIFCCASLIPLAAGALLLLALAPRSPRVSS